MYTDSRVVLQNVHEGVWNVLFLYVNAFHKRLTEGYGLMWLERARREREDVAECSSKATSQHDSWAAIVTRKNEIDVRLC